MGNDLLKDELQKLQLGYRNILENASENIYQNDSEAVVDEINIFWHRNKKLVKSILRYLHKPYSAYVFTAATILDMDDYEHYPFVTLGKYHFWDDPIYKYVKISEKGDNNAFGQKIREQVVATIKDNIKIIDNAGDVINILPIRLLTETDFDMIHNAAQQAFLSLFDKDLDFNHYRNNFNTISDIKNGLVPGIEKSIIFSEDDDNTLDFETRFRNYKESTVLPLPTDATDAEVFWLGIYSYLAQSFDIILMCAEYQLIPYIRFDVTFKYVLLLSGNFRNQQELTDMIFKCAIAYMLRHSFDKGEIRNISFREYYQAIQDYNFETKIFSELKQEEISLFNPSLNKVKSIIDKNVRLVLDKYFCSN